MNELDKKINRVFEGAVVRKDLVKEIRVNSIVPSYVLEYLLGQYCATTDEDAIKDGIESVKNILAKHYVQRNESELVKSNIREKGHYRIIDKVDAVLDEKTDTYKAAFSNLGISKIPMHTNDIKKYPRLLVSGIWCLVDLEYQFAEGQNPWIINSIKPIQLAQFDYEDYLSKRKEFTTDEWINLILQSIGFNPEMLSKRNKLLQLIRLIPYCERNYHLIELGPKGTGKSHIYQQFSPHGILISGSEVSAAKLFVNNSRKHDIGLVGYWDNIAFDEFAGSTKKVDKVLVDIMKGYMATHTFSRGVGELSAEASMTFVGNTKHNVPYMLKHSNLFEELPSQYLDSAFLDRLHFYIPGWEIDVIRNELFTNGYGFVVDYYAEVLKTMRNYDYSSEYKEYFELSEHISIRDLEGIRKTFSGLMKIIYPDKNVTPDEIEELLKFAMEGRKRVKDQILRIDSTLPAVEFTYTKKSGEIIEIKTLEELRYTKLYNHNATEDLEENETNVVESLIADETKSEIKLKTETKLQLEEFKEKHFVFEEGQIGISYEKLFAPIFKGAKKISIIDPYIRNYFQIVNLMELLEIIERFKPETEIIEVELSTSMDEINFNSQSENLETVRESCIQMGIEFSFKYDPSLHARSITTDTGWKVLLDRGLDIYQNCERKDALQFTTRMQKFRPCKRFEITYLRT